MRSEFYTFPAIFEYADDGINVRFVDLPEAITCGHSDEDAMLNAEDVLAIVLYEREHEGKSIPPPTPITEITHSTRETVVPIRTNMALARVGIDNKAVNVTVTLPRWLRDFSRCQRGEIGAGAASCPARSARDRAMRVVHMV